MKTIKISEFKAKCLELLDSVDRTRESLVITRRGRPLARILPVSRSREGEWMGSLEGTARITADLIEPAVSGREWEAVEG